MKRVIIIGAGPAGLAAANTLATNSKDKLEIFLIDQGKRVEQRTRTAFDAAYGVGGVGAFSDGKFIFETALGKRQIGTNLNELIGQEDRDYLIKARLMFQPFYEKLAEKKMQAISEQRITKAREIARLAGRNDIDYIVAQDYHIGTDKLPQIIELIEKRLEDSGVKIITDTRVSDFDDRGVYLNNVNDPKAENLQMAYDYLVVCPGRDGSSWLAEILEKRNIAHGTRPIDIGVRIETDASVMQHLTDIERDVKFEFRHPNGDMIRTFCVCPNGQVTREKKAKEYVGADFCLVNGASNSQAISQNTNFALLVRMPLRNDANNTRYGKGIAELYAVAGVDKLILQRYGDLKQGRGSKSDKVNEWRIQPTLPPEHFMFGDVRIGMPARIMEDLRYGIEKLSLELIPGLNQDSTLLYGPEIKFHGLKIHTDKFLQSTSMPNIYFAGDGTGIARGIGGSIASGIRAAEGILKKL